MPIIRTARKADLADAEYICIQTAGGILRKNKKMEKITALMFSTYYINEETEHCFVLEDNGNAVGYILCAPSAKRFAKRYRKDNLKKIADLSALWAFFAFFTPVKYSLLGGKYPAHLHIDILEKYQSSGYGKQLMSALLKHLKESGVKGVMLSCSADNSRAIAFYKKFGFKKIISAFGGTLMGKEL